MWEPSSTEAEDWDDAPEDGLWPVKGVVGEEVDTFGTIRYEVRWDEWQRRDGTSTTWEVDYHDPSWERAQAQKRAKLAEESMSIDLAAYGTDITNTNTILKSRAYDEKLEKRGQDMSAYLGWDLVDDFARNILKRQRDGQGGGARPSTPEPRASTSSLSARTDRVTASSSKPPVPVLRNISTSVASKAASTAPSSSSSAQKHPAPVHLSPVPKSPVPVLRKFVQMQHKLTSSSEPKSPMHTPHNNGASAASKAAATASPRSPSALKPPTLVSRSISAASKMSSSSTLSAQTQCMPTSSSSAPKSPMTVPRNREASTASKRPEKTSSPQKRPVHVPRPVITPSRRVVASASTETAHHPHPLRCVLAKKWTDAAKRAGAAPVDIINDVDDDEVPPLVERFQYLERIYLYDVDVERLDGSDCLVTCDCAVCDDPQYCTCQDPSELRDEDGRAEFAYTEDGLFAFNLPQGVEVIECNERCACDDECINRVAQKPRKIPIEIFKTRTRGWGARATRPIEKGRVIGLYTGLLIRRENVRKLSSDRRDYCFNLDVRENRDEDEDDQGRFTVDSYSCGNWTRFINHSCNPNLRVFPVVYDTVPEMNIPYLAFVALKDILPRTELTVDYDPKAGISYKKGKLKKRKIPEGAKVCECRELDCRGWL